MGVRAEYHPAAAGHGLAVIAVDICHICRYIYTAEPVGCRKGELMVVLIYGTAYGAEAVMAVGEYIWNGKFSKPGGSRRLYHAHICDVVAREGIKPEFELFFIPAFVMGLYDGIGHSALFSVGRGSAYPGFI